jgi:transposase
MKKEEEELSSVRKNKRGHFETGLREELIKKIEAGTPRSVIVYQYGVSRAAISKWMRDHSSEEYQSKRSRTNLTQVEKRSVVRQIAQGQLTPYAARKAHGISGNTLNKWLKASVKENAELAPFDPFEMKEEPAAQPALPDPEKEALKKALQEAQLKISALNTLIDVAEDQFKIAIRKKAGAGQSK